MKIPFPPSKPEIDIDTDDLLRDIFVAPGDTVAISGSIIEGFGNKLSDFDTYIICDALPTKTDIDVSSHHWVLDAGAAWDLGTRQPIQQVFDYIEGTTYARHAEYISRDAIEVLIRKLDSTYEDLLGHTHQIESLSVGERQLLHRLRIAVPLREGSQFKSYQDRIDQYKLAYIGYRGKAGGYPDFRDIIGFWMDGRGFEAVSMMRMHLWNQLEAFCYLAGSTNPNRKWVLRRAQSTGVAMDDLIPDFIRMQNCDVTTEQQQREMLIDSATLLDAIYLKQIHQLNRSSRYLSSAQALALLDSERAARPPSHPTIVEQYRYREKLFRSDAPSCVSFFERAGAMAFAGA